MKQIVELSHTGSAPQKLLESMMAQADTVYIVRSDYEINTSVRLHNGSELRIEGGSIRGGRIYIPYVGQDWRNRNTEYYSVLTLSSRANRNVENGAVKYTDSKSVFLTDGCYIKSTHSNDFDMYLKAPCRVMLPFKTPKCTLHIASDKSNTIQIDGRANFQLHAEDCLFERIFACQFGWSLDNPLANSTDYNIFERCDIFAEDYPLSKSNLSSNFMSLVAGIAQPSQNVEDEPDRTSETLNCLTMRDCVVENLGLNGYVHVENCSFLFGNNVNDNFETIHCDSHSRILNCTFDGRYGLMPNIPALNADVIDTFNGHDIIIDGCTFVAYKSAVNGAGYNLITVKSHYTDPNGDDVPASPSWGTVDSEIVGPQYGVIIRNCYFDLPKYESVIIEVWNGVRNSTTEVRSLNRQFTLIEDNYLNISFLGTFLNCVGFTDYTTVRGNVGTVGKLVYINDNYLSHKDKNVVHNLIIDGNILRFTDPEETLGMTILYGTHIDNLELTNNKVMGYVWNDLNNTTVVNLSGTIRVCDNETTGPRGLFQDYREGPTVMPSTLNVFFSGNVSKGVKTDVGPMSVANDQASNLKFVGRQFFCTDGSNKNRLLIFDGTNWIAV